MVSNSTVLDEVTVKQVLVSGHSRLPVYRYSAMLVKCRLQRSNALCDTVELQQWQCIWLLLLPAC